MERVLYDEGYNKNAKKIFIKKQRGTDDKDANNKIINQQLLDASLHSFDPNKSSPPNDFFMKSYMRLKHY